MALVLQYLIILLLATPLNSQLDSKWTTPITQLLTLPPQNVSLSELF